MKIDQALSILKVLAGQECKCVQDRERKKKGLLVDCIPCQANDTLMDTESNLDKVVKKLVRTPQDLANYPDPDDEHRSK